MCLQQASLLKMFTEHPLNASTRLRQGDIKAQSLSSRSSMAIHMKCQAIKRHPGKAVGSVTGVARLKRSFLKIGCLHWLQRMRRISQAQVEMLEKRKYRYLADQKSHWVVSAAPAISKAKGWPSHRKHASAVIHTVSQLPVQVCSALRSRGLTGRTVLKPFGLRHSRRSTCSWTTRQGMVPACATENVHVHRH